MQVRRYLFTLLFLMTCLGMTQSVFAVSVSWNASGDGTWDTGSNWSTGSVPTSGDVVTLNTTGTIDLNGGTGYAGTVGMVNGNVTNGTLSFASNMYLNAGTVNATLTNTGGRLWIGGNPAATIYLGGNNNVTYEDKYATIIGYSEVGAVGTVKLTSANALNASGQYTDIYSAAVDLNGQNGVQSGRIRLRSGALSSLVNNSSTDASTATTIGVSTGSMIGGTGNMTLSGVVENSAVVIDGVETMAPQGFTKTGTGTLTLTGANTFSGPLTVAEGVLSTSEWTSTTATAGILGASTSNIVLGSDTTAGTLRYTGGPIYPTDNLKGITLAAGGGKIDLATTITDRNLGFAHIYGNTISGNGGLTVQTENGNRFIIVGSSSYTGTTVIAANSELQCNYTDTAAIGTPFGAGANGAGSNMYINDGGILTFYSNGQAATIALGSLSGAGTIRGEYTPGNGAVQTIQVGGNNISCGYYGSILDGNGSRIGITKVGSDMLGLGGINSYSGDTTVRQGFLVGTVSGAFSTASRLVVESAGYVDLSHISQTVKGLSGSGYVYSNVGTLDTGLTVDVASGVAETFGGVLGYNLVREGASNTNVMSFTKAGAGEQILTGNNTYIGDTTINDGTLSLNGGSILLDVNDTGHSSAFLGTGKLNLNGTLWLDVAGMAGGKTEWTLVNDSLTTTYGSAFGIGVVGGYMFTENPDGNHWTFDASYQGQAVRLTFTESSGLLTVAAVPEPGTLALMATGVFGLIAYAWRKRK
jgi:fibronectin-binding autotransporter adhesin